MLIVYLGMNYANFDKMIAKRNIERYEETGKIDIEYLTMNTQTDAIEEIVEILEIDDINEEIKTKIEIYLQDLNEKLDKETDFRDFNISKQKAKEIIEEDVYKRQDIDDVITDTSKEVEKYILKYDKNGEISNYLEEIMRGEKMCIRDRIKEQWKVGIILEHYMEEVYM